MNPTLTLLSEILEREAYQIHQVPADGDDPEHVYLKLDDDHDMQALVLPGLESELPDVRLLQFYVPLTVKVEEPSYAAVREALMTINLDVPLVGFNLHEELGFLYFRTVQVVPASPDAGTGAAMLDMVNLAHFVVSRYEPQLGSVAG